MINSYKTPIHILMIVASLVFAAFSTSAQKKPRPGELLRKSNEAFLKGDYRNSLTYADSAYFVSGNDTLTQLEANALRARANVNLGYLNKAEKNYRDVYLMSQEIFPASNPSYRNALFNYAQFLIRLGRYDECIALTYSLPVSPDSLYQADILGVRAAAQAYSGNDEEALLSFNDAIGLAQKFPQYPNYGTLLQSRAFLKSSIKDFTSALEDYNKAIPYLSGKTKGTALANRAIAYAGLKDYKRALASIDEAIKILKPYGDSCEEYIVAIRKKAQILYQAGKFKKAVAEMNKFFSLESARLISVIPTLSPETRLDYWTKEKPLLSKTFIVGNHAPKLAFDVALMRRMTSLIRNDSIAFNPSVLTENSVTISKKLKANEAAVAFVLYEDENDILQNVAITLDSQGRTKFIPLFPQDSVYKPLTREDFSLYEAVTINDPELKNRLYTDTLTADALWQPIIKALPENTKVIHFAPEGIFHLWGIENMPYSGKNEIKAIRHFTLNDINKKNPAARNADSIILIAGGLDYDTLPGETFNAPGIKNTEAYDEILRSSYKSRGSDIFSKLPGTRLESVRIGEILDSISPLSELSETNFKNDASKYSLIHLATHGYTFGADIDVKHRSETDSLGFDLSLWRSGIALSGANVAALNNFDEDGILSAREICDIDLSNNQLIVLSACETAQGKITDESASGLIRGMKNAGASTIVASLWEVDDESTQIFMTAFHEAINQGASNHDALVKAQDTTKNYVKNQSKRKLYAEPWYWAPFIIIDP